jgi:hypothetical protein
MLTHLAKRLGNHQFGCSRGNIGTELIVNAPPDGYTSLLASVPNAVNATLYEELNFDFIRDIAPGRPCQAGILSSSSRKA